MSDDVRSLPEWIGTTPNTQVPERVKKRIHEKQKGICKICGRLLVPHHWDTDHITAIINRGENRESNLQAVCDVPCHTGKSKEDVRIKSEAYRRSSKHVGVRSNRRPSFPTNRNGPFKRKIDGTVIPRPAKERSHG